MNKVAFEVCQPFMIDLSHGGFRYGPIPERRLAEVFKDGRVAGLLNEDLAECIFRDMDRVDDRNAPYDLLWHEPGCLMASKIDMKGLTRNGVNFLPSYQKGKGRKENTAEYFERRNQLDYYIVADIRLSPIFVFTGIPAQTAPDDGKWSPSEWDLRLRVQSMPPAKGIPWP